MKTRKRKTILDRVKPVGPLQRRAEAENRVVVMLMVGVPDCSIPGGGVQPIPVNQDDITACVDLLKDTRTMKDPAWNIQKLLAGIVRAWLRTPR